MVAFFDREQIERMLASGEPVRAALVTGDVTADDVLQRPAVQVGLEDFGAAAIDPDNYSALIGDRLMVVEDGQTIYSGPVDEYQGGS